MMKQELNELVTQYNNTMFMKIHDYKIKDYREKYTNLNEIINQFKIFLASLQYKDFDINYNENECDQFIESFFNKCYARKKIEINGTWYETNEYLCELKIDYNKKKRTFFDKLRSR